MPENYTKCPWCGGSFDDYAKVRRIYPYTEDNPEPSYYYRFECQNCLFSFSEKNWEEDCYDQKRIDEAEEAVLCDNVV